MITIEKYIGTNYQVPSTNRTIDMIVLHSTGSDNAEGAIAWFNNPTSNVSAHYLIDRKGIVYKLVRTGNIAWHAKGYNARSIGIELVQAVGSPTTIEQRYALMELIISLVSVIKSIRYLQGHYELSSVKSDPYEKDIVPLIRQYLRLRNINDETKTTVQNVHSR